MADSLPAPSPTFATGLRPFSIGELADHCFLLYRRHFIPLFYFSALVQATPFALSLILAFFNRDVRLTDLPSHPEWAIWFAGWLAVSFLLLTLGEGAMTDYVARLYLGESVSVRSALGAMIRRSPALLWSTLLKYVFIFLAFLPTLIPVVIGQAWRASLTFWSGLALVLAGLVLFMPWLILAVRYLVLPQAVMLDRLSGRAALRRSGEIVRYNPGPGVMQWGETRLSLILLVIAAANILIALVSRVPVIASSIEEFLRGNVNPATMSLSPMVALVTPLLNFLGSALVSPLYVIAGTLFYYDVRVRKEAYDVELLADSVSAATAAQPVEHP